MPANFENFVLSLQVVEEISKALTKVRPNKMLFFCSGAMSHNRTQQVFRVSVVKLILIC